MLTTGATRLAVSRGQQTTVKCTVFEIFNFKNAVTLKTGLAVRQGHLKYHPSIERIRLPIDVL